MATELTKANRFTIDADGDFFTPVNPNASHSVGIYFSTPGTGGSIAIKDSDGVAYRNSDDTADLAVAFDSTVNKYEIIPNGGHFNFTASGVTAGGSIAEIRVSKLV